MSPLETAAALREPPHGTTSITTRVPMERLRSLNGLDVIKLAEGETSGSSAIELYEAWLELHAADADAIFAVWSKLGAEYGKRGDFDRQVIAYRRALAAKPDLYDAAVSLGRFFEASGQPEMALAFWQKALPPRDAHVTLLNESGRVLEGLNRLDEAEANYTASLVANPAQPDVLHHWLGLRARMCRWPVYGQLPGVDHAAMRASTRALTMLALSDDPVFQTEANRSWIAANLPPAPRHLAAAYGHAKLRIGYLSSDFAMHPVAYLITGLLECHDRERFDIYGFCSTQEDGSETRRRIVRAFDTFVDVRGLSDEAAATLIRAHEIDILIDLNGLTLGTRLGILRWRPAPLQMTYLGYNGPLDVPELDYIIADRFVVPEAMADMHVPRPLYLDRCFQANDGKLPIAAPGTRDDAGLPSDAFVLCSFSNTYKVTEAIFDSWMEILRRAPKAVLWLYVDNAFAAANLRAHARRAGIADDRLILTGRTRAPVYRARLALADLFLDTYPYNAGTTASDALRVGLPLITISGRSFSARMAGSLLRTMGLEDGIVADHASYVDLAVSLATDPARYKAYRDRVTPELWQRTLGDTRRFCEEFESALFTTFSANRPGRP